MVCNDSCRLYRGVLGWLGCCGVLVLVSMDLVFVS